MRAGGVDPVLHGGQRGLAGIGGHVVIGVWQGQRQLLLGQRHTAALLAPDHRNGLSPIALTGEHPVAQLEVDLLLADALLLQILDHALLGVGYLEAVEDAGVDQHAVRDVGIGFLLHVAARDHLDDGQAELLGELPVARIVRGHGHDCARAIGNQHIVRHPHRDLAAVDGIDGDDALQAHARLVLVQLRALKIALLGGLGLISAHCVDVLDLIGMLFDDGMLGRNHHVGCAVERIRARGEHAQLLVQALDLKIQLRALGSANPVALLRLDLLNEVHVVQTVEQLLRVIGDLEHPLGFNLAHDLAAAALAHAADHLFVGQTHLAARAPVDGHLHLVGQAVLVELQEDPLRPLVVVGIGGIHLAVPVKAKAQHLELAAEAVDVVLGHDRRVNVVLDGIVLGGQSERIPADGEQHVVALQALLSADDVHGRVGARMPHVQTRARGVRELDQRVELGLGKIVAGGEGILLLPDVLPLPFDGGIIIRCVGHET